MPNFLYHTVYCDCFSPLSLFCFLIIIGETTLKEVVVFLCG